MTKRASGKFQRNDRDLYPTPLGPVLDLSPYLADVGTIAEPFVGDGAIVRHLESLGHRVVFSCDIKPVGPALAYADTQDAMTIVEEDLNGASHMISNPPWPKPRAEGEPTLGFIRHLAALRPTWLLLSADFKHNVYASEVMAYCVRVVSVGRVKWIEDSDGAGFDNAAWYLFDRSWSGHTIFHTQMRPRRIAFAGDLEAIL